MLITVRSSDDPSLYSLARWFEEDGYGVAVRSSGDRPGAQGALDVIDVILSNSTAIAALIVSYSSWRGAKPHDEEARFTFHRGDVKVSIVNPTDEEVKRVIEALSDEDS